MNKYAFTTVLLAMAILLTGSWSTAQAAIIYYKATDLVDSISGEDLWQYDYRVTGKSFLTDQGFDIFFPVSDGYQNGDLDAAPSAPNSDWDVASIQPEPGLPHDGFFEAFAKTDNADLKNWFSLSFIWRGIGQPGSQAYDIIDTDLSIITSGNTVPYNPNPSVPEPAVWLLLLTGLIYFGRQFYRYKHSVPLFGKEWLGKILFNKSLSIPLFQRGEVTAYLAIESEE